MFRYYLWCLNIFLLNYWNRPLLWLVNLFLVPDPWQIYPMRENGRFYAWKEVKEFACAVYGDPSDSKPKTTN